MSAFRRISNCRRRASPSVDNGEEGTTLAELLVVLAIISILAVMGVPYVETVVQRRHELALRETLRETRRAIDTFHADWKAGYLINAGEVASSDGYPLNLQVLVDGVELSGAETDFRRYLRDVPANPFARRQEQSDAPWILLGYRDLRDAEHWNGEDIYDLRPRTNREALDGTQISDW